MIMFKELQKIYDEYSIEDIEYQGIDLDSEITVAWLSSSIDDFKENFNVHLTNTEKERLLDKMQKYAKVLK